MGYGSAEGRATDFAITTVNVPDRLDMQDMDDRKQSEEEAARRGLNMAALHTWLPRLTILGIALIVLGVAWNIFADWKARLAPQPLSQTLSASLGVPVQVEGSQLVFTPSPRLSLARVVLNNEVELKQVSVDPTSRYLAQGIQGHGWRWAVAHVASATVTLDQAHQLLNLQPKLEDSVASAIAVVRIDDLRFSDEPWLAGSWKAEVERIGNSPFGKITLHQATEKGSIQIVLSPQDTQTAEFDLHASNWVLPFGPRAPIETATATGKLSLIQIEVSQYSLSGPWGLMHGNLAGSDNRGWTIAGDVLSDGIDIDALLREIAPPPKRAQESDPPLPTLAQGIASFDGRLEGKGTSLHEAADLSVFSAPVKVRSAVLNGINLGFVAMNPESSGDSSAGSTRFASLEGIVVADGKRTSLRDLRARAGALLALGEINIAPDQKLSGLLHVDLGTTRVQAAIRVGVHGTLAQPVFGHTHIQ